MPVQLKVTEYCKIVIQNVQQLIMCFLALQPKQNKWQNLKVGKQYHHFIEIVSQLISEALKMKITYWRFIRLSRFRIKNQDKHLLQQQLKTYKIELRKSSKVKIGKIKVTFYLERAWMYLRETYESTLQPISFHDPTTGSMSYTRINIHMLNDIVSLSL